MHMRLTAGMIVIFMRLAVLIMRVLFVMVLVVLIMRMLFIMTGVRVPVIFRGRRVSSNLGDRNGLRQSLWRIGFHGFGLHWLRL